MEIKEFDEKVEIILDLDLDSRGTKIVNEKLGDIISKKARDLYFNLSKVKYLDSSGINLLLKLHKDITDHKKSFFIVNIPEEINKILRLSHLDKLFKYK